MTNIIASYRARGYIGNRACSEFVKGDLHTLNDLRRKASFNRIIQANIILIAIIAVLLLFYNDWFKFISIPVLVFCSLWWFMMRVNGGLSATKGGSDETKLQTLQKWFGYELQDYFTCYTTGGHDFGEIIVALSQNDFYNLTSRTTNLTCQFASDTSDPDHPIFTRIEYNKEDNNEWPKWQDKVELDFPSHSIRYTVTFW